MQKQRLSRLYAGSNGIEQILHKSGMLFRRCMLLLCNTDLWPPEERPC